MRHLGSIILSLVLTPVIYVLVGIGMAKTGAAAGGTSTDFAALAIGFVTLVSASLLYALLVLSRLSPLGPTLGALVLLVAQVWLLFDRDGFLSTFPRSVFGISEVASFPAGTGVALLLAIPMLATIVSPRRWRTSAQPAAPTPYAAAPPYGYQPYTPSYPPAPGTPFYPGAPGASTPPSAPPTSAPPTSAPPIPAPPGWVPPVPGAPTSAGDDESSATRPLYPAPSSFSTPPAPPAPPRPAPPTDPDRTTVL